MVEGGELVVREDGRELGGGEGREGLVAGDQVGEGGDEGGGGEEGEGG